MKLNLLPFLLLLILVIAPMFIHTAIGQPPPPPPKPIPIDGGLSLLIIAGMAYGAKRLHSAEKTKKDSE